MLSHATVYICTHAGTSKTSSAPPAQPYHPLRASVPPDHPLTQQFPGRLPVHDVFEQITDILVIMLFVNCPSCSFSQPYHVCTFNLPEFIIFSVFFNWTLLQLFEECLLAPAISLTLPILASFHFLRFFLIQLFFLHFPCDLRKQYPYSLQRVRSSICLTFNNLPDLCLVFLFEAEHSNGRELQLVLLL